MAKILFIIPKYFNTHNFFNKYRVAVTRPLSFRAACSDLSAHYYKGGPDIRIVDIDLQKLNPELNKIDHPADCAEYIRMFLPCF